MVSAGVGFDATRGATPATRGGGGGGVKKARGVGWGGGTVAVETGPSVKKPKPKGTSSLRRTVSTQTSSTMTQTASRPMRLLPASEPAKRRPKPGRSIGENSGNESDSIKAMLNETAAKR